MRIPYSVQMRKNADPNNSKLGHFLRSVNVLKKIFFMDYCVINKSVETHTQRFPRLTRNFIFLNYDRITMVI